MLTINSNCGNSRAEPIPIGDLTEIFAAFPKSFMVQGREFHEPQERDLCGTDIIKADFQDDPDLMIENGIH